MAKAPKPDQAGKIKVRIIELELEGSDESLQEGLKSFAAALNRPVTVTRNARSPAAIENKANGDVPAVQSDGEGEEQQDEQSEDNGPPTQKRVRKAKTVVPAKVLSDIEFDDVEPSFLDFAGSKSPKSDFQKYLVIAYWFKTYKNLPDLTSNHFYTAYKMAKWAVPRDPTQPMRDLKNPRTGKFSSGKAPGTVTINQVGENAVDELPGS